jgi:hypothetical protein
MGAVYEKSLKDLEQVLRCRDQEIRKLGYRMSETVILGSLEIWRQNAREIQIDTDDEANAILREEATRLEGADIEKQLENGAEEGIDGEEEEDEVD